MRERLESRLTELRKEYEEGQKTISALEEKLMSIRAAMLRISGAIEVLEEELARQDGPEPAAASLAGNGMVLGTNRLK